MAKSEQSNENNRPKKQKEPVSVTEVERGKTDWTNASTTTIAGDSMVRKVFHDKLLKLLNSKYHVVLFGGAKTQSVKDFIKPAWNLTKSK